VNAAEEPQRRVPAQLFDDLVDERLGRATSREVRINGRALLLEVFRLVAEDRALVTQPSPKDLG
jgi:hypothetical protein